MLSFNDISYSRILFEETFDNNNLSGRGWYDNTSPEFSVTETAPNSAQSLQRRFLVGATTSVSGGAMRRLFDASDSVYISYYIKYSDNWQGSGTQYPPHEVHLMTNKDSIWNGMAFSHLTTYIEQLNGRPRLALQDGRNIDQGRINSNLVEITENRSVMGCNGDSDGHGDGTCYNAGGGSYWNGKDWINANSEIQNGKWHQIEIYYKLNSIINGIGISDGVMQYWLDKKIIHDYKNITFRTGQNFDMLFNQFIIAPFMGGGSPIVQTIWYDNLKIENSKPSMSNIPAPPNDFRQID